MLNPMIHSSLVMSPSLLVLKYLKILSIRMSSVMLKLEWRNCLNSFLSMLLSLLLFACCVWTIVDESWNQNQIIRSDPRSKFRKHWNFGLGVRIWIRAWFSVNIQWICSYHSLSVQIQEPFNFWRRKVCPFSEIFHYFLFLFFYRWAGTYVRYNWHARIAYMFWRFLNISLYYSPCSSLRYSLTVRCQLDWDWGAF